MKNSVCNVERSEGKDRSREKGKKGNGELSQCLSSFCYCASKLSERMQSDTTTLELCEAKGKQDTLVNLLSRLKLRLKIKGSKPMSNITSPL